MQSTSTVAARRDRSPFYDFFPCQISWFSHQAGLADSYWGTTLWLIESSKNDVHDKNLQGLQFGLLQHEGQNKLRRSEGWISHTRTRIALRKILLDQDFSNSLQISFTVSRSPKIRLRYQCIAFSHIAAKNFTHAGYVTTIRMGSLTCPRIILT